MLKNLFLIAASTLCLQNIALANSTEEVYLRDPMETDRFSFPQPNTSDLGQELKLWATYYYTPEMNDETGEVPLRNKAGDLLGPKFSKKDWCTVALEGSVRVKSKTGQDPVTYNYAGTTSDYSVSCKEFFKFDVSKTKFMKAIGPWGDGLPNLYVLSPFRTIATDLNYIKPGTVLFIPQARGAKITLPNGKIIFHDGYFFAGDKGGAIKGSHIDVFIGINHSAPYFPWIKSKDSGVFNAYIVKDQNIISELTTQHAQ